MARVLSKAVPWLTELSPWRELQQEFHQSLKSLEPFLPAAVIGSGVLLILLLLFIPPQEFQSEPWWKECGGVHILATPDSAYDSVLEDQVDIVAVHGFGGEAFRTWTYMPSESGKLSYTVNWLSDMIPIDIKVARIFTFGFSSSQSLRSIATRLLVDLVSVRTCSTAIRGADKRPIIFVCHGLGGNIVKLMILLSRASQSKQKREIFEHTRGILFFGTRHSGKYSDSLWFYPRWILGTISFLQMHFHIDDMPSLSLLGDQDIERSNAQFSPLLTKLHISCFYNERYGLLDRVFYTTSVVVPAPAASLPGIESIGLRGSLAEMVKFSSPHDPGYKRVIATLQYAVQHITSTPHPQFIPPAELHNVMELQKQKGLNILSLDGGGVRGLSSLLILRDLMYAIKRKNNHRDLAKPCNIFDVISGTSTGGLIAIMLGRLRMDVDSCIIAYTKLSRDIFERRGLQYWGGRGIMAWNSLRGTAWFDATRLEKAIREILEQRLSRDEFENVGGNVKEIMLLDPLEGCCKTFVCAIDAKTRVCKRLRSYYMASNEVGDSSSTCTIIEAARATSAAPLYFPTMKIGNNEFFDGALKSNNPVLELINETRRLQGNRPIKCVVSIGTGKPNESNHESSAIGAINTLKRIATDTEHPHYELMTEPAYADIRERYFRLNVENGLSNIGMERWDLLSGISENTTDYLQEHETRTTISQCAQLLAS